MKKLSVLYGVYRLECEKLAGSVIKIPIPPFKFGYIFGNKKSSRADDRVDGIQRHCYIAPAGTLGGNRLDPLVLAVGG